MRTWSTVLVTTLFALSVVLAYLLFALWPPRTSAADQGESGSPSTAVDAGQVNGQEEMGNQSDDENVKLFWGDGTFAFSVSDEQRLILLVMVTAALGSYVHAATSLVSYLGNRKFKLAWVPWYLLRGPIGVALGLVFYVVIRAGLFSANTDISDTNPYGFLAVTALAGMFSKQATDKLDEVFKAMFRIERDPRADKLENPEPKIGKLEPLSVAAGTRGVVITVTGDDFVEESTIRFNGSKRDTTYHDETKLTARLVDEDTAIAGTFEVTVFNPAPGGGLSNVSEFRVT